MTPATTTAPAWVPIRSLGERHRPRMLEHLLGLGDADRTMRFGHLASDDRVRSYVEQIDFSRDDAFGIFDRRLQIVALVHLAADVDLDAGAAAVEAEFGISVSARAQRRGLGSRMYAHAVTHARNRGLKTLVVHTTRDNAAMLAIVRAAGAELSFDGAEGLARLHLPPDTLGSQIEEMIGHHAAEIDYRLKCRARRMDAQWPVAEPRN